jgi:hypothetical protein
MLSHSDQAIDAIPDPQLCESCGEVTYEDDDMCGECKHGFYESLNSVY